MVLLIHHPVSAASRKVRIIMAEKRMLFVLKEEEPWKPSQDLYKLNPSGEVPVFRLRRQRHCRKLRNYRISGGG